MIVGTVREVKVGENRVGLTPSGAAALTGGGHEVLVQATAGRASGFEDDDYRAAGARIAQSAGEVWTSCDLVVKVKEPIAEEFVCLSERTMLFTYLHLAAARELAAELLARRVTAFAYETVELPGGALPLLAPMSAVAGRMAIQVGAHYLERTQGGSGKLLGGVPGVTPASVMVLGTGTVGASAIRMAHGLGAQVIAVGRNLGQLEALDDLYRGSVHTLYSTPLSVAECVQRSDLVVGAVAVTGARAAKLITRAMLEGMRPGSVLVDVSIDQGGCSETSRVTTHQQPTYIEAGVIHYCVSNMPGAVPNTSTCALTNATLPYVMELANAGNPEALRRDSALVKGLNTHRGDVVHASVAAALA